MGKIKITPFIIRVLNKQVIYVVLIQKKLQSMFFKEIFSSFFIDWRHKIKLA